jgi:hypothetical protein
VNDDTNKKRSPEEVRRIFERATELESAQEGWLSVDEMKAIAHEVGIDPATLLRAIHQVDAQNHRSMTEPFPKSLSSTPWMEWVKAVGVSSVAGAVALGVGILTGITRTVYGSQSVHLETLAGMVAICIIDLWLSLYAKGRLRHVVFQASNFALWCGFALGFGATYSELAGDATGVALAGAGVSGIIGAFVVWYRNRNATAHSGGGSTSRLETEAIEPGHVSKIDRDVILRAIEITGMNMGVAVAYPA